LCKKSNLFYRTHVGKIFRRKITCQGQSFHNVIGGLWVTLTKRKKPHTNAWSINPYLQRGTIMKKIIPSTHPLNAPVELSEAQLDQVAGGAPPAQGSGKNEGGNKVGPFAGNPHNRPGANAKVTPPE
jgi:hypothetical protein